MKKFTPFRGGGRGQSGEPGSHHSSLKPALLQPFSAFRRLLRRPDIVIYSRMLAGLLLMWVLVWLALVRR